MLVLILVAAALVSFVAAFFMYSRVNVPAGEDKSDQFRGPGCAILAGLGFIFAAGVLALLQAATTGHFYG